MWKSISIVLLQISLLPLGYTEGNGPLIEIRQGILRGKFMKTKSDRQFSAFLGIPYAKPPIGHLRFKAPEAADSWPGVRDATEVHTICPQRDIYRRTSLIEGDEDCLYLNVYTPQTDNPLPVMIFFHGGGWLCGGGNSQWYGPDILLDRDIVLVVTNYRLGALGFLSTGDEECPGNNGLKDQNLAMRWVKDNIGKFGGDPGQITLFGESAGGASVQFHMISPLSKDLFQAAISQSGTALCYWALAPNNQGRENSKKLANLLNCPTSPSAKMLDCLRQIHPYKLIEQDRAFMEWDSDPMIPFKPVIEPQIKGAFLTEHPIDAVKAGRVAQIPWIVGLNSEDGALRVAGIYGNPHLIDELDAQFDRVVPMSLEYDQISTEVDFISKQIRKFYFGNRKIDNSTRNEVVHMYTDGWFLNCADQAVLLHLKHTNQPIYYYLFAHKGVASFTAIFGDPIKDYGVCHADELQYLFPVGEGLFPDKTPRQQDKKVAKIMTNLWANFAAAGDPTPETSELINNKWEPVKSDSMEYYYIQAENPEMRSGLYLERAKFWRNLPIDTRKKSVKDEL